MCRGGASAGAGTQGCRCTSRYNLISKRNVRIPVELAPVVTKCFRMFNVLPFLSSYYWLTHALMAATMLQIYRGSDQILSRHYTSERLYLSHSLSLLCLSVLVLCLSVLVLCLSVLACSYLHICSCLFFSDSGSSLIPVIPTWFYFISISSLLIT